MSTVSCIVRGKDIYGNRAMSTHSVEKHFGARVKIYNSLGSITATSDTSRLSIGDGTVSVAIY